MTTQVTVAIPSGGASGAVVLSGSEVVGAFMLPITGTWPPNFPSGNLPAALQMDIQANATGPIWEPVADAVTPANGQVTFPPFGSSNAGLVYVPFPTVYRDLPDTIRLRMLNAFPADVTVVLVLKAHCEISISGC